MSEASAPRLLARDRLLRAGDGAVNEDRVGVAPWPLGAPEGAGLFAYVLDGATDATPRRLLPGPSDAAWLVDRLEAFLLSAEAQAAPSLEAMLSAATERLADEFARARVAEPAGVWEHPAAAGVLVRWRGGALEWLRLADCRAVAVDAQGTVEDLGGPPPRVETGRLGLNQPGGYGVFSITPPPPALVRQGGRALTPGARLLLASDGLTRLVDLFERETLGALARRAASEGLDAVYRELRAVEASDPEAARWPRAKVSDDVAALLLEAT